VYINIDKYIAHAHIHDHVPYPCNTGTHTHTHTFTRTLTPVVLTRYFLTNPFAGNSSVLDKDPLFVSKSKPSDSWSSRPTDISLLGTSMCLPLFFLSLCGVIGMYAFTKMNAQHILMYKQTHTLSHTHTLLLSLFLSHIHTHTPVAKCCPPHYCIFPGSF
jgi:hypothetical protein